MLACSLSGVALAAGLAGMPLEQALERLGQDGLDVVYSSALVTPGMRVLREPRASEPRAMLEEIVAPHGLAVEEGPNGVLMLVSSPAAPGALPDTTPAPVLAELEEVVVSAGHFRLDVYREAGSRTLTSSDLQVMPEIADDPLRAVARLPGIARQDYGGRPHIRGGAADETLIRFDGLRLYDPFHLKDFQSIFSTVDPAVVKQLDVYTAAFPAFYGDRMSGVIDISRVEPRGPVAGQLALSLFSAGVLLHGATGAGDTDWLLAARRGMLDVALDAFDSALGSPRFRDLYGRVGHRIGESLSIAGSILVAEDDLTVFDSDQEEGARAEYRDEYAWLRADAGSADGTGTGGYVLVSRTRLARERAGSADLPGVARGWLEDRRRFAIDALQADGWLPLGPHSQLRGGIEWRRLRGSYAYQDEAEFALLFLAPGAPAAPVRSRSLAAHPDGHQSGAYVNWRTEPLPSLTTDLGLRWDRETLSGADAGRLSPRVGLLWQPSPATRLRLGWGRFFQAQGVDELAVSDGDPAFHPAQRADHLVAGLQQRLAPGLQLRLEAYRKSYARLRPRYENLLDSLVVLPELKPDRVRVAPEEATAYGADLTLELEAEQGVAGWLSYSWSKVRDEIAGGEFPRNWDQTSYLSAGVARRGPKWDLSLAASWRSGWPTTALELVAVEPVPLVAAGPRNADRLADYLRVDARVARRFDLDSLGRLTVFVEVSNLTNRRNDCCAEYEIEMQDGGAVLDVGRRRAMPAVPSVGFVWDF